MWWARRAIYLSFIITHARVELQVLGLIGKLITGPWMRRFYISAADQNKEDLNHLDGVEEVRA